MRTCRFLGAVLGVTLAAGCVAGPRRVSGEAAPVGAVVVSAASASPRPPAPVLGPHGLGALRLGMSWWKAEETGLIVPFENNADNPDCTLRTHLRAAAKAAVYFSEETGVEVIDGYAGVRTPEGIRIGSTLAEVRKAYPDWYNAAYSSAADKYADGHGVAKVPGNKKAHYRIALEGGRVVELTLQSRQQNCYE